jgi:creatinine amidohydrolase/Fe(II)-dependent formamide hydrolase-like protein
MAYAGTISVPPRIFADVLKAAAESFKAHGFKTIVLLGDSGPNQAPQQQLAVDLSRAWSDEGVRVINADTYYAATGQVELLKSEGETDATIGQHASIRDTSELMAVLPEGIRADKLAADSDGVVGDARRASAERGAKFLALKVDAAVRDIEEARKSPPPPPLGLIARLWRWIAG